MLNKINDKNGEVPHLRLKQTKRNGYISIEYVLLGCLVMLITIYGTPRIYKSALDLTDSKKDKFDSYIYDINTSTDNIWATGGKESTDTVIPDAESPIDPGDDRIDNENKDDGLIHPTAISVWVDAQATGGPISETTEPIYLELYPKEQIRVNGRVLPINSHNKSIRWVNYNTEIATANQNGLITAINPGDALVRVEAIDNNAFNEVNIHVRHIVPTDFNIVPNKLTMSVGDVEDVYVKFTPEDVTLKQCVFKSSNTGLLQVEQNTDTTAILYAVNAEKEDNIVDVSVVCQTQNEAEEPQEIEKTLKVEVIGKMVNTEGIKLDETIVTLEVDDTYQINATVYPEDATVKDLSYESLNTDIATVDVYGKVTARAVGETYIYIRNYGGDYYGKEVFNAVKIVVIPKTIPITGLDIEYSHSEIPAGTMMSPLITFTPDNTTQKDLIWNSSNEDVLKVGLNGQVQGVEEGTAIITATSAYDPSIKDSFAITVTGKVNKVTGIILIPESIEIWAGDTTTVVAHIQPTDAFNKNVIWSTGNSSVCTVNNGVVVGISAGDCTITGRTEDGNYSDSVTITVREIVVDSVTITPEKSEIGIGDVLTLEATISPANATKKGITWSYYEITSEKPQENIIILDNGLVTGIGYGTVVIRATAENGKYAEATVTVSEVTPTSIEMIDRITLNKGASYTIEATVLPENSTSKALTWTTSNSSIVTVNQNGMITASSVFYGEATITATWTNGVKTVSASTIVEVLPTYPEVVTFSADSYAVQKNGTAYGTLTILPTNTDFQEIVYTVGDDKLVEIVDNGLDSDGITHMFTIKGLEVGETTLTATTINGVTETVSILVTSDEIIANYIYADDSVIELEIGETFSPEIKFEPSNTTNKNLTWESSDSLIASVSQDGAITGVSEGITYVTVQSASNGSWYEFTVIVTGHEPQKLSVTPHIMELGKFQDAQDYFVSILPSDSIDTGYYYEVYNSEGELIEDVDTYLLMSMTGNYSGSIFGVKTGEYTVRFIAYGYPDLYDEVKVLVKTVPWDGNVYEDTDMDMEDNTCYPEDGWQLAWISYQSNNGKLADYCTVVSQKDTIDLNDYPWTPMGVDYDFQAIYLGNGYEVQNLYVDGSNIFENLPEGNLGTISDYGLFGRAYRGIYDLTIDNAIVSYDASLLPETETFIGVLAGRIGSGKGLSVKNYKILIDTNASKNVYVGSLSGLTGDSVLRDLDKTLEDN